MNRIMFALAAATCLTAPVLAQTPDRPKIEAAVKARHAETVKALQDWIALPTIAAEKKNVPEGAAYMQKLAREAGFTNARIIPTSGVPGVFGTIDVGAPTTVGIYFMYDVKQYDPAEWTSPPLEGRVVDRAGEGKAMIGRGSVNQKGSETAVLAAIRAIKDAGKKLPVNIVLIAEGEEEIGSPNFHQIVADPEVTAALKRTSGVFIPFNAQDKEGGSSIILGAKGVIEVQLIVGGETAPNFPKADTHSSNAPRVANPAWRLVKALDTLVAEDGHTPAIDGWYENVHKLTPRQKELAAILAQKTSETDAKRAAGGIASWNRNENYQASIERLIEQPTVTIQGLVSGYTGPGGKTVLPGRAEAKLDLRLVPGQTKDEAVAKLNAHLAKHGFSDVKVVVSGGYGPTETAEDSVLIRAQKRTLDQLGIPYTISPRLAGSWPGVLFTAAPLSLPAAPIGIGRGGAQHAPDEWFLIDSSNSKVAGLDGQVMMYVDFFYAMAAEGRRR